MKKIVIGDIVSRAWDLAVKHWPIFVLLVLLNSLLGSIGCSVDSSFADNLGNNPDPQVVMQALSEAITVTPWIIVGVLISLYIGFVMYRMLRNAIVKGRPYENLLDELKIDLTQFALFFVVELLYGIAVGIGFMLCIIPGIFISIRWMFAPYIMATENVGITEAFGRSWNMTKGNFWDLFLLGLVAIGIIIVGFCACCVGVLFAEVIVDFMLVLAYFALKPYEPEYEPSSDIFEEVVEDAKETVEEAVDAVKDTAEDIADAAKDAAKDTTDFIEVQ